MTVLIISGIAVAFVLWCCCKAAGDADRKIDEMEANDAE